MNSIPGNVRFTLPAALVLLLMVAVSMRAQVKTESSTASGQATVQTQVERGEVVTVSGNDLVVKMEDGSLRHFANVPESARATVEGKELGIHDLKPGMKLERTITTTTTPKTITTVQTVTGTILQVSPPKTVTLQLEDNSVQRFNIPKGQKFMVDGKETDAFGLKKGLKVSATKIVEAPETQIEQQRKVTGTMPPPPAAPPADQPILVASAPPATPPQSAAPDESAKLPATASPIPLVGLFGTLSLAAGLALRVGRFFRRP
jgi:RNase P/RNase MRP subunit p29